MPSLYPEQQAAIDRALAEPTRRFIFYFDTGCGKTPTAIQLCKQQGFERILVVCPAIVKWHWAKEFTRWGYADASTTCRIEVVSYESMTKPQNLGDWQAIIFDELHYLQTAVSKRSQNAFELVKTNPKAFVLGLTATLMPTYPWAIWNPLRTFWPDRWGNPTRTGAPNWNFCERYFTKNVTEYGVSWGKIKPEREEELAKRIEQVSHRLTRGDVARHLPPFNLQPLYIPKEPDEAWFKSWIDECAEDYHIAIFTYFQETAQQIAKWLRQWNGSVYLITGNEPPEKRIKQLEQAKSDEDCIIVCTMSCIGTGIDLTWLDLGLCVEWTQSPGQMVQFIGRISRLNCPTKSTLLTFLCTPKNEVKASKLVERIQSLNKVIRAGEANDALEGAFSLQLSDEEFQASLDRLCKTFIHLDEEDLDDDADLCV